jgi:cobalamin synthase
MAGVFAMVNLAALHLKKQLGGLTGDTYGAVNEIAFVTALLMINMLVFKHWLL